VDRLAPGTINTWDLLKKAFIQRYCLPFMTAKQLKDIHNFKQEGDESLYQAWERYNDLLYKCPTHDINSHQKVGCQICEGPHLDKDCPLNEEVKQVEEVRYGEFGRTTPFNGNNEGKFRVGLPGYYTKTDNHTPYGERRKSLEELLTKHQEESARRSTEMEIEQLTKELRSRKEESEQAKVVIVEHEGPSSPKKLKNLHGISFLSDSHEENTIDQLPMKESNPGHFTLLCTIDPDKDPLERCLDEYNWVFPKEIEQLANEYEIKIREKGQVLEEIWTRCKRARCSEDYNPPMVNAETFEVTKYKFNNRCSFICVSSENNETLSLGRKNGSRFRKMIMEEMEEVLGNDGEDSDEGIKSLWEDGNNLKISAKIQISKQCSGSFLS
ncbi:cysteine-rich receptor-like protein kinase, partial [Tanacetum coccineum]